MSRRWVLPAVILVLLFTASLVHVEPGTWGVLKGVAGGPSFIFDPGLHFRIPFFQRLASYPSGPFPLDFDVRTTSREGSELLLGVRFQGRILRETLVEFSDRAAGRNGPTAVEEDLRGFVTRWVQTKSAAEIPAQPLELRESFRGAARANGFEIKTLIVSTSTPGSAESSGGGRLRTVSGAKVVLIGLDGADWQLIDPLAEAGKLPTLARLKRDGAWASLRSMEPMLSPLLWTTVATGKPPEEHGVVDFLVRQPSTGKRVPVSSEARQVKALWNIFTEAGRSCDVVAWWATWPAEKIAGTLVSDRVAYSLFDVGKGASLPHAVFPESYAAQLGKLRVSDERMGYDDLRPFVRITRSGFEAARRRAAEQPGSASRDPVIHLTRILASTRTYQAVGLDLLSKGQPDLLAVYYQGIDEVSHRFAHFAVPKMEMVSEADYRRFRQTVAAFYQYQDRLLGELLSKVDPGSLVLILSDHGFRNGAGRPRDQPPDIEGQPARWHRPYGIFLARGPMIAPGEKKILGLLDIAPTVLLAAGLPVASDMPGKVPDDLFAPSFLDARRLPPIATYETGTGSGPASGDGVGDEATERAMLENLRALGYISAGDGGGGAGPAGAETAYSHANLAGIYLQKDRLAEAEREAKKALEIAPGYLPALVFLAEVYQKQGRFAEALSLARQAATTESPDRQSGIYLLLANLYVSLNRSRDGITDLSRLAATHDGESDLHSALGVLYGDQGDRRRAEGEYLRALSLDPTAAEPVTRLFTLYEGRGELGRLVPVLQAALKSNEQSPFHHNWLGLVYEKLGNRSEAEGEYRKALKSDPEMVSALVNFGNLLARQGRLGEAIPLLRQALDRDPKSLEARVGLGAALGIQGKTEEAIQTLEAGLQVGPPGVALYNALAMAYDQAKQREKAIRSLKESLKLNPKQESARSLLAEWEKR